MNLFLATVVQLTTGKIGVETRAVKVPHGSPPSCCISKDGACLSRL